MPAENEKVLIKKSAKEVMTQLFVRKDQESGYDHRARQAQYSYSKSTCQRYAEIVAGHYVTDIRSSKPKRPRYSTAKL